MSTLSELLFNQLISVLGFHTRQAYVDSLNKGELLIAKMDGRVVGFVRYHHTAASRLLPP